MLAFIYILTIYSKLTTPITSVLDPRTVNEALYWINRTCDRMRKDQL